LGNVAEREPAIEALEDLTNSLGGNTNDTLLKTANVLDKVFDSLNKNSLNRTNMDSFLEGVE